MVNTIKKLAMGVAPWFQIKVIDPLLQILSRGAEPKQLAFSGALGITLGLFPICGVTVFLCGFAIAVLGSLCHAPTVMLANFVATPVELSLVIPFLRFGEFISGGPHFPLTSDALKKVLTGQASLDVLHSIFHALGHALWLFPIVKPCSVGKYGLVHDKQAIEKDTCIKLLGWLVAAPIILMLLYVLLLPCFVILVRKFSAVPASPKKPLLSVSEVRLKMRDV